MLDAHMDRSGSRASSGPFEARVEGAGSRARGRRPMKGALAACMVAGRGRRRSGYGGT